MLRPTLLILVVLACAAAAPAILPGAAPAHPQDGAVIADVDHDQVKDPPIGPDNCSGEDGAYNPSQVDTDSDGRGDACDIDDDDDTVDDAVDNCPVVSNQAQADLDGDAIGDVCDVDDDGDGFADSRDNCRFIPNADQADANGNQIGDACDESTPGGTTTRPAGGTDVAAPDVAVALRARHRTAELGAGLAVPVSCSERCTITSTLNVGAREARRLRLADRVLGRGGAELDAAGETFVFVDLARGVLRRVRRPVPAVLSIDVADAAGNHRSLTRRLTIRR